MTTATMALCPECQNSYKKFTECPECNVPLLKEDNPSIQQDISGNESQGIIITGGNTARIDQTIIKQTQGEEVASYDARLLYHTTKKQLAIPTLIKIGIPVLLALFQYLGTFASIFSYLEIKPSSAGFLSFILYISTLALFLYAFVCIYKFLGIITSEGWRANSELYEQTEDGRIAVGQISASCPVDGCSGTIHLKSPKDNEEGIHTAGICNMRPSMHIFDFDPNTYKGKRIKLTAHQT